MAYTLPSARQRCLGVSISDIPVMPQKCLPSFAEIVTDSIGVTGTSALQVLTGTNIPGLGMTIRPFYQHTLCTIMREMMVGSHFKFHLAEYPQAVCSTEGCVTILEQVRMRLEARCDVETEDHKLLR